jgi:xanthine phosphoribosyltransferase
MKELEEKILQEGIIINNKIIKVDSFINHQIDVKLINDFALRVKEHFKDERIDKVLTIETSGIAIAYAVSQAFDCLPLVFAKKNKSQIIDDNVYKTEIKSFTRDISNVVSVSKKYLRNGENILIVDDFLAEGNAAMGLIDICEQAGARVVGFAAAVEKEFQGGSKRIREKGVKVYCGAVIKRFENNKPVF